MPTPVTVALSIDLESTAGRLSADQLAGFAENLFCLLDRVRIPATWSASDPTTFPIRQVDRRSHQEFALQVDRAWSPETLGRPEFAHQLRDRVEFAQQAGLRLQTICVNGRIDEHYDLLVKHRISVVRGGSRGGEQIDLRSARFGVWHAPQALNLPASQPWWLGGAKGVVRRAVTRAAADQTLVHIAIDAPAVVASNRFVDVGEAIRWLEKSARSGTARVCTLASLSRAAQLTRTRRPSRSILRAA